MELLRNSLERCGYKKINKPKDDLFWSRIGSGIRGENQIIWRVVGDGGELGKGRIGVLV